MKKLIISTFVIISFIAYSVYRRAVGINDSPVVSLSQAILPQVSTTVVSSAYKDGSYIGAPADAFYGNVQVKATIQGNKIVSVQFLDYPKDRQNSLRISMYSMPILKSESIQAQSSQVDVVSGATATSFAFMQSIQSALSQAN